MAHPVVPRATAPSVAARATPPHDPSQGAAPDLSPGRVDRPVVGEGLSDRREVGYVDGICRCVGDWREGTDGVLPDGVRVRVDDGSSRNGVHDGVSPLAWILSGPSPWNTARVKEEHLVRHASAKCEAENQGEKAIRCGATAGSPLPSSHPHRALRVRVVPRCRVSAAGFRDPVPASGLAAERRSQTARDTSGPGHGRKKREACLAARFSDACRLPGSRGIPTQCRMATFTPPMLT